MRMCAIEMHEVLLLGYVLGPGGTTSQVERRSIGVLCGLICYYGKFSI